VTTNAGSVRTYNLRNGIIIIRKGIQNALANGERTIQTGLA
jgi:hypothetical protein